LHASVIEELKRLQDRVDQLEGVEAANEALRYELEEMRQKHRDMEACRGDPTLANSAASNSGSSTDDACGAASRGQSPASGRSHDQAVFAVSDANYARQYVIAAPIPERVFYLACPGVRADPLVEEPLSPGRAEYGG